MSVPVITTPTGTVLVVLQTIAGTADPGATVFVYSGNTLLTTTNADSNGNWNIFVTLALGINNITAVEQIHGLTSTPSNLITITIGVVSTNSPVITTPSATTNNPSQTIAGTAASDATVKVYSGTTLIGTTTANSNGNWNIAATLATGANTITATATINGVTSPPSNSITITVTGLNPPIIASPSSGSTVQSPVTIAGTAASGATVKVYSGTTLIGTTTANSNGNWNIAATLATGANTITATQTLSGLTSSLSIPDTFTVASGNTIGKVTGGGGVGDSKFAFVAKSKDGKSFSGNLEFKDKPNKITFKSDSIISLSVDPAGNTATFGGTGTIGGTTGYTFKVSIADNGEPGKHDVFSITIFDSKGNQVDSVGGTLTQGNIQIHTNGNSSDDDDANDFKDCQKLEN